MIPLDKPVVFFDLESTGVAPLEDRIIDIALLRRMPDGREEVFASLVDPGVSIPPESSAIHHITDGMVQGAPAFKALAPKILEFIGGCDLAGFGVARFDIPMLQAELKRASFELPMEGRRVVDALTIFHKMEPRNLGAAFKFYCGKSLEGAHRAEADARAAASVFWAQLERYPELPKDMAGLAGRFSLREAKHVDAEGKFAWRNGQAAFNFGKYRTKTLQEVIASEGGPGYLDWVVNKADKMSPETKQICRDALAGRFPIKPAQPG
ncbi:MAG: 3'-5' exonuclease [Elusimicrobiota bacterium]